MNGVLIISKAEVVVAEVTRESSRTEVDGLLYIGFPEGWGLRGVEVVVLVKSHCDLIFDW